MNNDMIRKAIRKVVADSGLLHEIEASSFSSKKVIYEYNKLKQEDSRKLLLVEKKR